ncbi:hypothetical protein [Xanthomonas sp. LF06-19]|uniref:hypothetical protein n=1 Tax=Xanthomonas sp. LF06-19 TaxID=3097551 RepID=UPI002A80BED8|nr:hypothetical protein [Xanthomonas sp. LF06-19]MDY4282990.1 hypothetical protein [Xanthomonas sp. LF06-19]
MTIIRNRFNCDLFSFEVVTSERLKLIGIYDKDFRYKEGGFQGYFGVKIERINLVRILIDLRSLGINCFSVPHCYKEKRLLGKSECLRFAKKYASSIGASVAEEGILLSPGLPLYQTFNIVDSCQEKAGGVVRVDRLDGHIWTLLEFEEYMYDFNGLLI